MGVMTAPDLLVIGSRGRAKYASAGAVSDAPVLAGVELTATSIRLTLTGSTDADYVSSQIWRRTGLAGAWSLITILASGTYDDTVSTGVVYDYLAVPRNADGANGPPSNQVTVWTVAATAVGSTIESALRGQILSSAAIVSVVGVRVYPLTIPQAGNDALLPAITYQRISGLHDSSHDGPSGLATCRMQINCWAATFDAARELGELVRKRLDGTSGTWGTVEIGGCFLDNDGDLTSLSPASDDGPHATRMDFTLEYTEATS
jgi:hypothetical protein